MQLQHKALDIRLILFPPQHMYCFFQFYIQTFSKVESFRNISSFPHLLMKLLSYFFRSSSSHSDLRVLSFCCLWLIMTINLFPWFFISPRSFFSFKVFESFRVLNLNLLNNVGAFLLYLRFFEPAWRVTLNLGTTLIFMGLYLKFITAQNSSRYTSLSTCFRLLI